MLTAEEEEEVWGEEEEQVWVRRRRRGWRCTGGGGEEAAVASWLLPLFGMVPLGSLHTFSSTLIGRSSPDQPLGSGSESPVIQRVGSSLFSHRMFCTKLESFLPHPCCLFHLRVTLKLFFFLPLSLAFIYFILKWQRRICRDDACECRRRRNGERERNSRGGLLGEI